MKRSSYAPKNKLATFTLSEENIREIEELLKTRKFPSKSEIVRQAISAFHWERYESRKPKLYAQVQAKKLEIKEKEKARQEQIANLNNEEYCTDILMGMVADGKCYLPHPNFPAQGGLFTMPLENVKKLSEEEYEQLAPVVVIPKSNEGWNDQKKREKLVNEALDRLNDFEKNSPEWWEELKKLREEMTERYNT